MLEEIECGFKKPLKGVFIREPSIRLTFKFRLSEDVFEVCVD